MSNKNSKRKKGLLARSYQNSLIISTIGIASAKLHKAMSGNASARIFCGPDKLENAKNGSLIGRGIASPAIAQLFLKIKTSFARLVESSTIVSLYRRFVNALLCSCVRDLGVFFLSFGLFSLSSTLLRILMFDAPGKSPDNNIICIAAALMCSIPMLASKKSIASRLEGSAFVSFLLFDIMGISPLALRAKSTAKPHSAAALVLGTVTGTLTYLFEPPVIIGVLLLVILGMTLLYSPESGLLLTLAIIPLASYKVLRVVIFASTVSYLLKLLRGKRNISFSATDISVILFSTAAACAIGPKGLPALLTGCFVYLSAVNLIRSLNLLEKSINALCLGLFISSVAAAAVSVSAMFDVNAAEYVPLLSAIDVGNASVLSLICAPVALFMYHNSKKSITSAAALLLFLCSTLNAVLSFSLSIWCGYLAILVIYSLMRAPKPFETIFWSILAAPFVFVLFYKLSTIYKITPFNLPSVFKYSNPSVVIFGGAAPAAEDSLLSAIVSSGGCLLLLLFVVSLFLLFSTGITAINRSRLDSVRLFCGSITSLIPALIYIFALPATYGDMRILLMSFCITGLISCSGNVFARRLATEDY